MCLLVFLSLLAFAELRCGVYGEIELLTTLNAEGIDSRSVETDSTSSENEHYSYTSEVNAPETSKLKDLPAAALYEQDPFQQLGVVYKPQHAYFLEEGYEPIEPTLQTLKEWPYSTFKDSLLRAVSNEETILAVFDHFNKRTSKRTFIDGLFYTLNRRMSAREMYDDADPSSTGETTDDVDHLTEGMDHESVELDSSRWDSIGRSGLIFEEKVSTEAAPVLEDCDSQCKSPLQAGSIRGIPGEHFPDYSEIPITSFSCADKKLIPGFYADLETGCQVFHVCWPHRRESFLCPIGTTFNQPILACDYWYSTNCSLAPLFFDIRGFPSEEDTSTVEAPVTPMTVSQTEQTTKILPEVTKPTNTPSTQSSVEYLSSTSNSQSSTEEAKLTITDWIRIFKFLPVKSKIIVRPVSTKLKDVSIDKQKHIPEEKLKHKSSVSQEAADRQLKKTRKILKELMRLAEKIAREEQSSVDTTKLDTKPRSEKTKLTKAEPVSTTIVGLKSQTPAQTEKVIRKPVPKIIQRFVVKPVGSKETITTVTRSASVKPLKLMKLRKS